MNITYLIILLMMINSTYSYMNVNQFDIQNIEDISLIHTFKTPLILKVWAIIEIMIYLLMRYRYI
jgi:hypothetical protein